MSEAHPIDIGDIKVNVFSRLEKTKWRLTLLRYFPNYPKIVGQVSYDSWRSILRYFEKPYRTQFIW